MHPSPSVGATTPMKRFVPHVIGLLAMLAALAAPALASAASESGRLVILSTSDVKGKTGPCGCHVPKGGLARQASFVDSTRMQYDQVLLVDDGGFFPDQTGDAEHAAFLMGAMNTLGVEAAGVSERELQFGGAGRGGGGSCSRTRTTPGLTLVSANLIDRTTHKPLVQPWLIVKKGDTKVGIFSVTSDKADPGSTRDSISVEEPVAAARKAVADLRRKGATVVVCLSQLGKVPSEDLATRGARDRPDHRRAKRAAAPARARRREDHDLLRRRAGPVHVPLDPHARRGACGSRRESPRRS